MPTSLRAPAYLAVADDLRRQIEHGDIQTGSPLPSASKLMARYQVSSTVIKNAMRELRSTGHVDGQQGKAVFATLPTGPAWLAELIDAGTALASLAERAAQDESKSAITRWKLALGAVPEHQLRRPDAAGASANHRGPAVS